MLEMKGAEAIILVRKKKSGHGGHHGGAWKVAYADFVTAMMSLFIVLWLTSTSDQVRNSVAKYFNDPSGTSTLQGTNRNGAGQAPPLDRNGMEKLKQQLMDAAEQIPEFDKLKKQVEISAEQDGLRIELMEQPGGTFFRLGSAEPTPALRDFLKAVSPELGKLPSRISIEGHTDSVPYNDGSPYTNWELSTDRANAARRLMQESGIGPEQVQEVRGFADQLPRVPAQPEDSRNRRVTLIVLPIPVVVPPSMVRPASGGSAAKSVETLKKGDLPSVSPAKQKADSPDNDTKVSQDRSSSRGYAPIRQIQALWRRITVRPEGTSGWRTYQSFRSWRTIFR
jgi:chemotaxis protein MotB